mmetsp:Transcript_39636/g.95781  ORF Transcript_39636/g.95781 Transcript_39636/m.95781 type:complete len:104 (-) Transcript_39636:207-518(-)
MLLINHQRQHLELAKRERADQLHLSLMTGSAFPVSARGKRRKVTSGIDQMGMSQHQYHQHQNQHQYQHQSLHDETWGYVGNLYHNMGLSLQKQRRYEEAKFGY